MAPGRHSAKGKAKAARVAHRTAERDTVRAMLSGTQESAFAEGEFTDPNGTRRTAAQPGDFSHLRRRPKVSDPRSRSRRGRRRRLLVWLATVLVVVIVAGFVGFRWVEAQVHPSGPPGKAVTINVPAGASASKVADMLSANGVIDHPLVFRLYLRIHPVKTIVSGPYRFHLHESFASIETTFGAGPDPALDYAHLTIPEGFTEKQIAAAVGNLKGHTSAGFLAALSGGLVRSPYHVSGGGWEGLLFPDTYFISPNESDVRIAQQMSDQLVKVASSIGLDAGAAEVGLTPIQAITVASIVQREAKSSSDMAKVAEVVYNRLKEGMKLQLDSTVIYALSLQGQSVTSELTDAQTSTPSPYNTYLHTGLPPGPIAAPGEAALEATLHPTQGPWLYYVTIDKQGDEAFSTSLSGQNANIALARQNGCPC